MIFFGYTDDETAVQDTLPRSSLLKTSTPYIALHLKPLHPGEEIKTT